LKKDYLNNRIYLNNGGRKTEKIIEISYGEIKTIEKSIVLSDNIMDV